MEAFEVVIVGAGIAGLATCLGLHRLGIQSLVLESSASLRVAGFGINTWSNAWRALDVLGVANSLRKHHLQLHGLVVTSPISSQPTGYLSFLANETQDHEVRCLQRRLLLEALEKEMPRNTIRYSSKVVSIENSGFFKLLHLADGTILKTKVLIGCDGVNSVVAKWLGFKKPASTGRLAVRAFAYFQSNHGFEPKFLQFMGNGFRSGFIPCDDKIIYWFFTWSPSYEQGQELEDQKPAKLKQLVLEKSKDLPDHVKNVIETTSLDNISLAPIKHRYPWEVLLGDISKGNVCVAGDALHPMAPDLAQGGCSSLEDGVVLARCLYEALSKKQRGEAKHNPVKDKDEYKRIEKTLKRYANERKWRSFDLITTSYIVGFIQQSSGKMLNFLRDKILSATLAELLLKKASFDCGKLSAAS